MGKHSLQLSDFTHINDTPDVVAAWDSGIPLAALCGYSRLLVESKQLDLVASPKPVCPDCAGIALTDVVAGRGVYPALRTPAEMRARLKPRVAYQYSTKLTRWA
jgi:hypothetical protein